MKIAQLHEQIEQMAEKQKVRVVLEYMIKVVVLLEYFVLQYDCEEFEVMVQEEREKCQRQLEVTRELVNTIAAQVNHLLSASCLSVAISYETSISQPRFQ